MDTRHQDGEPILYALAGEAFGLPEARGDLEAAVSLALQLADEGADINEAAPAPIWDLTTFVEATQVSAGTHSLLRHGRGDELADVLEASAHSVSSALGKQLRGFGDDIRMMRVPQLLDRTGPELLVALHNDASAVAAVYPPVRELAARLEPHLGQMFPGCTRVAPISPQGVLGAWVLARWLLEMDLVPFAAGLLRESILTAWTLAAQIRAPADQLQPRANGFGQQRSADDQKMKGSIPQLNEKDKKAHFTKIVDGTSTESIPFQMALLAKYAFDLRNDILHCGFRAAPAERDDLLARFETCLATAQRLTAAALSAE